MSRCSFYAGACWPAFALGIIMAESIARSFTGRKRIRKTFGRIPEVIEMPNLIEVQRSSYEKFLQMETRPEARIIAGLEEDRKSVV